MAENNEWNSSCLSGGETRVTAGKKLEDRLEESGAARKHGGLGEGGRSTAKRDLEGRERDAGVPQSNREARRSSRERSQEPGKGSHHGRRRSVQAGVRIPP